MMSRDCAELYGNPPPPPYLNSALFVLSCPDSRPTVIPAIPVSLVTCISAFPDFLTCISFAGISVPTPINGELSSVVAVITPDATILVVSN